jgi:hypothetical protein
MLSDGAIGLFIAAACATVAYTKIGKRMGYDDNQRIVTMVCIIFVFSFIISYTLIKYVLRIS